MMGWECFLIETGVRYVEWFTLCEDSHRCVVETVRGLEFELAPSTPPSGWPENCPQCGERLNGESYMSHMGSREWVNPATGEIAKHQHDFGPGAMYDADWLPWKGTDGLSLSVVLPPGDMVDHWHIDGPAGGGGDRKPWDRTGTPPIVTARPSILTPRYHGWLTDGVLSDPI